MTGVQPRTAADLDQGDALTEGPTLQVILLTLLESATVRGVASLRLSAETSPLEAFVLSQLQAFGIFIDAVEIEQRQLGRKLS